ncbi:hypothetical protein PEL8287_01685 [Roseovarius litorisediminis]|uniref:DNA alkylation repair enzyme n=1 Tax=Roseovarius litorisediminis TaxID=1312363 RepID=A0A1Y5S825_9RHOB|nr:hypothetical protein [Roseovarius litorisediminis]SLN34259.1 hypothetical protein PEL8287_01685 [Roseovarius litorisediminis]
MAQGFLLKDHLFNADSIGDLAAEFAAGLPGFDSACFYRDVMAGLAQRELMARLEWIADCLEPHLSAGFPEMADQLQAAMVPELDPDLQDDDFGRFIHAAPGILAVRHGLEHHRERALDLLYEATKRFSMEFYIRPFLNRWPEETLARLALWAEDENYHVRRLVSEGTRPRLPWAGKITIDPLAPMPLLDRLHADGTRYVTRSVSNHLNDIAKFAPDLVTGRLDLWREAGAQVPGELDWMTRHALRTLVKQGHEGALKLLGFRSDVPVRLTQLALESDQVAPGGALEMTVMLEAEEDCPVIVDYQIWFRRKDGNLAPKVFKLKQGQVAADKPLQLKKRHVLKANATTFSLYPGAHRVAVQVNGRVLGEVEFEVLG